MFSYLWLKQNFNCPRIDPRGTEMEILHLSWIKVRNISS